MAFEVGDRVKRWHSRRAVMQTGTIESYTEERMHTVGKTFRVYVIRWDDDEKPSVGHLDCTLTAADEA